MNGTGRLHDLGADSGELAFLLSVPQLYFLNLTTLNTR